MDEESPLVPDGSIHKGGPHNPIHFYAKTDSDVLTYYDWHLVGYGFDWANDEDGIYSFKYFVNNVMVDKSI